MAQQFLYAPEAARGKDGGLGGVVHGVVFPSMLTLLRIDRSRRYVRAMPSSIRSAEGAITKVPRRSGRRIGIVKIHSAWSVTRTPPQSDLELARLAHFPRRVAE